MKLDPHKIHIWTASLNQTKKNVEYLHSILSADEQQRAKRLKLAKHQKRFIVARGLLRKLISKYLQIPPDSIIFEYSKHKKPLISLEQSKDMQFNLSHSGDQVLYAFCLDTPIGIDIEATQKHFNTGVVTRYFSKEEQQAINELSEEQQCLAFYQIWCKKEAVIKAVGKGLHINLSSFTVWLNSATQIIDLEGQNWILNELNTDSMHQAAVAYAGKEKELIYYNDQTILNA